MKREPEVKHEMNLMDLMDKFGSDDKCREYLEALRFPNGITCTRCNSDKISRIIKRNQFMCDACKYQFSAMAGTIFHDTKLPLKKWFTAVYLMCESRKGVSANQLKRTLNVSYKTAWYLCHRIRKAVSPIESEKLSGTIEVDEVYLGGRRKNMHKTEKRYLETGRGGVGKTMVIGAIERGGQVKLKKITDRSRPSYHEFIRSQMALDAKKVVTDENPSYLGIDQTGVEHEFVNHSDGEYVRNSVYTNNIESVFSLFKRSVVGSFHHISDKHLDAYLDEFEHRFNNRENPFLFRDTILRLLASDNLEYKDLVKGSE